MKSAHAQMRISFVKFDNQKTTKLGLGMVHTHLMIELVHRWVWSTMYFEANMERVKKDLLEEVLENISGRQFIHHCRWTGWSRGCLGRLLWALHGRLLWNYDSNFIGSILPGIGDYIWVGHSIVHCLAGWAVASRYQVNEVLIGSDQCTDGLFLLRRRLFKALRLKVWRWRDFHEKFCQNFRKKIRNGTLSRTVQVLFQCH